MTALSEVVLTPDAARVLTDEVKADAAALWSKLLQLYEGGAHKALGYSSWGAYYEAEFAGSKSEGYRLLDAARVVDLIPNVGNEIPIPPTVHHAQALVPVLREAPDQVEEVWADVVEEHGPEPTATQVREVVQHRPAADPIAAASIYAFVTEVRFQHDALDQASAEAWAQRLAERVSRSGVVCVHRTTRPI